MKKWAKDKNRLFSKEDDKWLINTWKDAHHYSLLRKCKSKLWWDKTSQNGHHQQIYKQYRCGEKGTLFHCWWECKLIQPLWRTVWRLLKKLGIKPPCDTGIPLLGIYPEESKIEKDRCNPMFIAALFTIARKCKQPRYPSTDEWVKKLWYICTKGCI